MRRVVGSIERRDGNTLGRVKKLNFINASPICYANQNRRHSSLTYIGNRVLYAQSVASVTILNLYT